MGRMKDLVSDDWDRAYREGYVDGLDTARKAIEKRPWSRCVWQAYDERANCIAAIDALREEKP